jgi:hypothetical protein
MVDSSDPEVKLGLAVKYSRLIVCCEKQFPFERKKFYSVKPYSIENFSYF